MNDHLDREVRWEALTAGPVAGLGLPLPLAGLSSGHAAEWAGESVRLLFPVRGIDLGRYVMGAL